MKKAFAKNSTTFLAALALAGGLSAATLGAGQAFAQTAASSDSKSTGLGCSAKDIEANKALALLFDVNGDWKKAYESMDPNYIQHNPTALRIGEVNGVKGREEFKLLMDLKDKGVGGRPPLLPGQPPEDTAHFVMANCDHVFLLKKSYLPDPQNKGKFYEVFDFDLWRVANGKLAEHWDGGRIPNPPPAIMTTPADQLVKAAKPPGG